jgi:hypothetical protein
MTIPRAVRELCDGIRLIRESLPTLYAVRDTMDKLMREVENVDIAHMQQQLEAELVAHNETRVSYRYEHENGVGLTKEIYSLKSQLATETAARKEAERKLADAWSEGFDACQGWLEPPDGKMGAPIPRNPYALESLAAMEKAKELSFVHYRRPKVTGTWTVVNADGVSPSLQFELDEDSGLTGKALPADSMARVLAHAIASEDKAGCWHSEIVVFHADGYQSRLTLHHRETQPAELTSEAVGLMSALVWSTLRAASFRAMEKAGSDG